MLYAAQKKGTLESFVIPDEELKGKKTRLPQMPTERSSASDAGALPGAVSVSQPPESSAHFRSRSPSLNTFIQRPTYVDGATYNRSTQGTERLPPCASVSDIFAATYTTPRQWLSIGDLNGEELQNAAEAILRDQQTKDDEPNKVGTRCISSAESEAFEALTTPAGPHSLAPKLFDFVVTPTNGAFQDQPKDHQRQASVVNTDDRNSTHVSDDATTCTGGSLDANQEGAVEISPIMRQGVEYTALGWSLKSCQSPNTMLLISCTVTHFTKEYRLRIRVIPAVIYMTQEGLNQKEGGLVNVAKGHEPIIMPGEGDLGHEFDVLSTETKKYTLEEIPEFDSGLLDELLLNTTIFKNDLAEFIGKMRLQQQASDVKAAIVRRIKDTKLLNEGLTALELFLKLREKQAQEIANTARARKKKK
ncbi:hypothetical protein QFC21_006391 [Naganishia friedmannii]|uniref:Uncharacterized protein n=1 Tax=Naganishia friedmannii TaxID=89922 RepID=A0ACC2V2H9_9TREE|nr:hypothetical protein QFC21_006391 [Naganishia friedmannii]